MEKFDRLKHIFKMQETLMKRIMITELEVDPHIAIPEFPITNPSINERKEQRYLRELGGRFIEELGEALIEEDDNKKKEELIDCLHFLTEFSLVVNYYPVEYQLSKYKKASEADDDLEYIFDKVIYSDIPNPLENLIKEYGSMMNCLRSKPWKRNWDDTDIPKFYKHLSNLWESFIYLMMASGMDEDDVWDYYRMKNDKNFKRQENGY